MSLNIKPTDIHINKKSLSFNDKVMHYLQNSTNNSISIIDKSSFSIQHRLRSPSENDSISSSSSSSIIDSLSRSDISNESSLSDPIAQSSRTSSNLLSEKDEIDFNIGFDQINNHDFDEDDDNDDDDDNQYILNKNNADAVTLLGESIFDARINELEEVFRQSSTSTISYDEYECNNDHIKQHRQYANFLNDSTYTLCSPDRFSTYIENDEQPTSFTIRSNSLSVLHVDDKSTFRETAPKKVVRFADMLGLDLESIRYMTPPDQTTTSIIQECVRLQLEQIGFAKNQLNIPNISNRLRLSSLSSSPTKQYNLVSKNFLSPIHIIPLIYENKVMLECLYTKDSTAYGTIRVHNCSYNKNVFVRLTQDEWETSNDIQASHSMNYSHDNTDTFTFEIFLPKTYNDIAGSKRILFAICLQTMSQEFWDNNQGWNYVLDVFEKR